MAKKIGVWPYGRIGVWLYNVVFRWLHQHDDHVRTWQKGDRCVGCEDCPLGKDKT